ncbi:MAG: hypothetical protein GC159_14930 [Phycisphaera sp.]|nr:hypothetical protein [Phycisphaera sp.]
MVEGYDETLLLGYVEGELNDAERQYVQRWLNKDPQLAELLQQMVDDRNGVRVLPVPAMPQRVVDEVDRELNRVAAMEAMASAASGGAASDTPGESAAELDGEPVYVMPGWMGGLAVAASIVILLTLFLISMPNPNKAKPGSRDVADNTLVTDPGALGGGAGGQPATSGGPDSAVAQRNPDGTLPYADDNSRDQRVTTPPAIAETTPSVTDPANTGVDSKQTLADAADAARRNPPKPDTANTPVKPATTTVYAADAPSAELKRLLEQGGTKLTKPAAGDNGAPTTPDERRTVQDIAAIVKFLRDNPGRSGEVELHIASRDTKRTLRMLKDLSAGDQPVDETAKPPVTYPMMLGVEQLDAAINTIATDVFHADVYFKARPTLAAGSVPRDASKPRDTGYAPWPSLAPDYQAILQQQIPSRDNPLSNTQPVISISVTVEAP